METTATKGGSGASCVVVLFLIVAVVVVLGTGGLATELDIATYPQNQNVPIAAPVSQHALEKHIEAENIQRRCDQNQHTCEKVYVSYSTNQRLYLFWSACSTLVDGKIETIGGKNITAFSKPLSYWSGVIYRDAYVLVLANGVCP